MIICTETDLISQPFSGTCCSRSSEILLSTISGRESLFSCVTSYISISGLFFMACMKSSPPKVIVPMTILGESRASAAAFLKSPEKHSIFPISSSMKDGCGSTTLQSEFVFPRKSRIHYNRGAFSYSRNANRQKRRAQ